jgi:hypothetical protein
MKNPLSLSKKEIEAINERHISGTDNWFRMLKGTASEIIDVKDGKICLDVIYSKQASRDAVLVAKI